MADRGWKEREFGGMVSEIIGLGVVGSRYK
jgi:hypothetical protein